MYVQRDETGKILAVYANWQEYATEELANDSPELVEFFNPSNLVLLEISDRQFFQQMAVEGRITETEALDAVGSGIIPAAMSALIAQLPEEQQFAARMLVRGATTFRRDHPVTALIGQLYGMAPAAIDELWRKASEL